MKKGSYFSEHNPFNPTRLVDESDESILRGGRFEASMDSTIRIGRILGIPLGINYSWLVVFGLVIFLMSARFGDMYPEWPLASRWAIALVTTALFFLSVLVHELSHSLVALAWGIPVRGITLFIFGGVSQLDREAERPLTEFLVSVIGPVTSLVLALVCGVAWYVLGEYSTYLSAVFFTLFAINLSLGIFNMLPGFPLDGGRVLRAGIWGATSNYWLATRLAIRAGQGLGLLMISGGVLWAMFGNLEAIWVALVGGFLFYVARTNYRQEAIRAFLRGRLVVDAMTPGQVPLSGILPALSSEVLLALSRSNYVGILVYGPPYGVVSGQVYRQTPSWVIQTATLADIMTPLDAFPLLRASASALDAMERMDDAEEGLAVVTREGVPLGMVSRLELLQLARAGRRRR